MIWFHTSSADRIDEPDPLETPEYIRLLEEGHAQVIQAIIQILLPPFSDISKIFHVHVESFSTAWKVEGKGGAGR